jgi:hypothetical protein
MWDPAPTKATLAAVPQAVSSRPPRFQCPSSAKRESALAAPKAVRPLPTWLVRFEDYEAELLAKFCPSTTHYPRNSTLSATARVEPNSGRPLGPHEITPLLGLQDSGPGEPGNGTGSEEDEEFYEWDADCHPFESDVDSDSESDYGSFESASESSTPPSCYWADAFEWPSPYQGNASANVLHESPPHGSPPVTSSDPHASLFDPSDLRTSQPPSPLMWSASTDPLCRAIIMDPPLPVSVAGTADDTAGSSLIKAAVDRLISKAEGGLEFGSRLTSESTLDSYGGHAEGWCDWSVLTDYRFRVPPQRPQSPCVASGFKNSPPYAATVPLAGIEDGIDVEFDAVLVVPRSPVI